MSSKYQTKEEFSKELHNIVQLGRNASKKHDEAQKEYSKIQEEIQRKLKEAREKYGENEEIDKRPRRYKAGSNRSDSED